MKYSCVYYIDAERGKTKFISNRKRLVELTDPYTMQPVNQLAH